MIADRRTPDAARGRRPWMGPVAALLLPTLAVLSFWWVLPAGLAANESSDYWTFYDPVARSVLAGEGVTLDGRPAVRWGPGFPVLLAGLFAVAEATDLSEASVFRGATLLWWALTGLFLYLVGRAVWGRTAWALVPVVAFSFYPLQLWLTKQPNSELPFMPLLFGAFWLLWRETVDGKRRFPVYVAIGAAAGAAMLVRPIAVGLGLVLGLLLWLMARPLARTRRAVLVGGLLVGVAATVLPWQLWVRATTGEWVLVSSAGGAALRDGLTFGVHPDKGREDIWVPAGAERVMWDAYARYDELESPAAVAAFLAGEALREPVGLAQLLALKAARGWYGTDSHRFERFTLPLQALVLVVAAAAGLAAARLGGRTRLLAVCAWTLVAYFWAMTLLASPLARYTTPAIGFLFLLLPALRTRPLGSAARSADASSGRPVPARARPRRTAPAPEPDPPTRKASGAPIAP